MCPRLLADQLGALVCILEVKSQWSVCAQKRGKKEERRERSGEWQKGVLAMVDSWHHQVHTPDARVIKVI